MMIKDETNSSHMLLGFLWDSHWQNQFFGKKFLWKKQSPGWKVVSDYRKVWGVQCRLKIQEWEMKLIFYKAVLIYTEYEVEIGNKINNKNDSKWSHTEVDVVLDSRYSEEDINNLW